MPELKAKAKDSASILTTPDSQTQELSNRLYKKLRQEHYENTDKIFVVLFIFQWLLGVLLALYITPNAWNAEVSTIHMYVWASILMGFIIISLPIALIFCRPGQAITRHSIAIAQLLTSALLIHLTGGRIETHFHIFGSLAFLSCYRDWRILVTATTVTILDHFLRGVFWPQSVYGVLTGSELRFLEHAGWVIFEDIVLAYTCLQTNQTWKELCDKQANLQMNKVAVEKLVDERTYELQNALQTTQDIYYGLSQHALLAITDIHGNVKQVNQKFCELSQYAEIELIGQNLSILRSDEHDSEFFHQLWDTILSCQVWQGEFKNRAKDGSYYWVQSTIFTLLDSENKANQYVTIQYDITELKQKRIESLLLAEEAQAASSAKSDFLANMSHEIRTPLNGIIGMTQLLLDTDLRDTQQDYCYTIKKSGEVLISLVNDILDFSKIEAGKMDIENIPFNLEVALEELIELVAHRISNTDIEFILHIEPDVPLNVIGDPGRIRQILLNFLTNAFKFTKIGYVIVRVSCLEHKDQQAIFHFSVEDTGKGIAEKKLSSLFEKFTQEDTSTTRQYGGTGLGLAICKSLVEMMGGKIGVESKLGKGTTFWFELNLPLNNELPIDNLCIPNQLDIRILSVSTHSISLEILSKSLNYWGINNQTVKSGEEAITKLRQAFDTHSPFHIMIIDGTIPEIDGIELSHLIKNEPDLQHTRLIVLTGMGRRGDAKYFESKGFDAYLSKPIHQPILISMIMAVYKRWVQSTPTTQILTRFSIKEQRREAALPDKEYLNNSKIFNILLVEDNLVNQKVASHMVKKMGFNVDIASNGREAIEMLSLKTYDAILMDCQMPEMDGYEATQKIRGRSDQKSQIPIIALTANALKIDAEKCLEAGMNDYLAKPVNKEDLKAKLQKWTKFPEIVN